MSALSCCRAVAVSRCRGVAVSRCRGVAVSRCRGVAVSQYRIILRKTSCDQFSTLHALNFLYAVSALASCPYRPIFEICTITYQAISCKQPSDLHSLLSLITIMSNQLRCLRSLILIFFVSLK